MIKRLSPVREKEIRDHWERMRVENNFPGFFGYKEILSEIDALREENKILYEALSASRGQWVHSVSNNICLAAISKYERNTND